MELVVWIGLELVPLSEDYQGMRSIHCLMWGVGEDKPAFVYLHVMVGELGQGIFLLHFGVIDGDHSPLLQEHVAYSDRGSLSHISSVLLESEAKDSDLLVG